MKIINSGNAPIRKDDVVVPIRFQFDDKIKVINWNVTNTKPKDIPVNLALLSNENKVQCNFDLLNAKDELKLQFICTDKPTEISIHGRIEAVKEIEILSEAEIKRKEAIKRAITSFLGGTLLGLITSFLLNLSFSQGLLS
jgi:hypothetical protein